MEKRYFYSLSFLKFVLSLAIVCHHFQQCTGTLFDVINFYNGKFDFGLLVETFFIVSGFLCMATYKEEYTDDFRVWFTKKIVRIYPMAMMSTVFTLILMLIYKYKYSEWWFGIVPGLWRVLNTLLLTFQGSFVGDVDIGINSPLWYLCTLIVCYILFWIIKWIAKRKKVDCVYMICFVTMMGVGTVSYGLSAPFLNVLSGRGYAAFFLGALLFRVYDKIEHRKIFIISYFTFIITAVYIVLERDAALDNQWGIMTFILSPSLLFIILSLEHYFRIKFVKTLGELSFEIYLWHIPLLILTEIVIGLEVNYSLCDMIAFLALVIGLSTVLLLVVERKINGRMSKKFSIEDKV